MLKHKLALKEIAISAVIASFISLSVHRIMLKETSSYLNQALVNISVIKPPYPAYINVIAYLTSILPGLGVTILYYLMTPYFNTPSKLLRTAYLSILLLLLKGELIRQLIMNILVGNPIAIAFLQQSQVWLTNIMMALAVVFLMPKDHK